MLETTHEFWVKVEDVDGKIARAFYHIIAPHLERTIVLSNAVTSNLVQPLRRRLRLSLIG